MTNPSLDQERAALLRARTVLNTVEVPAWPRSVKSLNMVELEVTWVKFSTLNHRTRAEQRAEVAKLGAEGLFTEDPLGPTAQEAQARILSGQQGFDELKADLETRGQQEPALVTADGVLINGNRRAAALRSLYVADDHLAARYIKCLVLPDDASVEELIDLETELQVARDFKQEYGWINEAFLIEELYEREKLDFARVASRMHRDVSDVRTQYDKLQLVHQIVELSGGLRQYVEFSENESAFEELSKHIKNKASAEAEAVRSVYFLGTLAKVNYRKLRHLRRPDAAELVAREIAGDVALSQLFNASSLLTPTEEDDPLADVLGGEKSTNPTTGLLAMLASKRPDDSLELSGGGQLTVEEALDSLQSVINSAAEEAEEEQKDQTAISAPVERISKAITEFERALSALPRARTFAEFDEAAWDAEVRKLAELLSAYQTPQP